MRVAGLLHCCRAASAYYSYQWALVTCPFVKATVVTYTVLTRFALIPLLGRPTGKPLTALLLRHYSLLVLIRWQPVGSITSSG